MAVRSERGWVTWANAMTQNLVIRSVPISRFSIIGSETLGPWIIRPQPRLRRHIKRDPVNVSILGVHFIDIDPHVI